LNSLNTKALYYCHTHPNLFLQKRCKECRRGMCHTCIHHNFNYCQSCLSQAFKLGSQHKNQQQVLRMFISGSFAFCIGLAYQLFISKQIDYTYLLLGFCIGVSILSIFYISKRTDVFLEISKVPFIGWKLAIFALILTTISGGPFLYFLYKLVLIGKSSYLKYQQ